MIVCLNLYLYIVIRKYHKLPLFILLCFLHISQNQLSVFVLGACALSATVYAQTLSPSNTILCRLCNRATNLGDCNKLGTCDSTLEECYMDELITDQLTVVYEGGCRAKDVCAHGIGKRKRGDLVSCSSCCNFADDCNKRLCNIRDVHINSSQCYSCDNTRSDQGGVKNPRDCVTLTVCNSNEVCYAQQSDSGGISTFNYGCKRKFQCLFLMKEVYQLYRMCTKNDTTALDPGISWHSYCFGNKRSVRQVSLCHSCCGDGGCNYGTCQELNDRLFKLADHGKFSFDTLKMLP